MADRSQIPIKPSPLRKLVWSLMMLGLLIGTGAVLWQAYRVKQAAVLAEGETLQPVQEAPAGSSAGAPQSPIATTPAEEFVHRVNTSVDFPPLPVSLSESDSWLRQELPVIDKNPQLTRWLNETPDLLRRFVVLVNETAQGRVAFKLFDFWAPQESIRIEEIGSGEYLLDPASYHRYDQLALAVEALDVELAWRLYQRLKPWINQVYGEFAQPGADFDQVLLQAIEHLLQTPQPQGDIRLIKQAVTYRYADPKLESLSAAQKQLLRMGPVNAAIIKHKLGLFRSFLLSQG
ncbi:MAG: DUF3014 domain-containing protein [Methylohalobius sp.]